MSKLAQRSVVVQEAFAAWQAAVKAVLQGVKRLAEGNSLPAKTAQLKADVELTRLRFECLEQALLDRASFEAEGAGCALLPPLVWVVFPTQTPPRWPARRRRSR